MLPDDLKPPEEQPKFYGQDYWDQAFFLWYNAGRPSAVDLLSKLSADQQGFMPTISSIRFAMHKYKWSARAASMDAEVMQQMRTEAIKNRLVIMRKQAEEARALVEMGMKFLQKEEGGIDKAGDAIRAVTEGWKKEYESLGADKILAQMSTWSNDRLTRFVAEQLASFTGDEAIPDQIPSNIADEIVDGEVEEQFPGEFDDGTDLNADFQS